MQTYRSLFNGRFGGNFMERILLRLSFPVLYLSVMALIMRYVFGSYIPDLFAE